VNVFDASADDAAAGELESSPKRPEGPRIGAAILSIAAAGSSRAVAARRGTTSEAQPGRTRPDRE
jgi:hypothetical protein